MTQAEMGFWRLLLPLALLGLAVLGAAAQETDWRDLYPYIQDSSTFSLLQNSQFDYIIVGGGTAGCPLAATLSKSFKVLLLERGGVPYDQPAVCRREGFPCVLGTRAAETFWSEEGVENKRGNVLGGGSAINAGFYSRASQEFIAESGWDPEQVLQSYEWVEGTMVSQPEPGRWQRAYRDAMLEAGLGPWNNHTLEHFPGTKLGNSVFDSSGARHTAADLLALGNSENLHVLIRATVLRIIFAPRLCDVAVPGCDALPKAVGVVFRDSTGAEWHARLASSRGEVLLTAGALGSPQLLMLSGVGPAAELAKHGIPLVADLPSLGQSITDIPQHGINVLSPEPVEESSVEFAAITASGNIIEGNAGGNHTLCFPAAGVVNTVPPSRRDDALTSAMGTAMGSLPEDARAALNQAWIVVSKIEKPVSRGKMWLKSAEISDPPVVQYNYFAEAKDVDVCVEATAIFRRILNAPSLSAFRFSTVPPALLSLDPALGTIPDGGFEGSVPLLPAPGNHSAAAQWCKDTMMTFWHFHGGCTAPDCVDSGYRVKGVTGVRVIDGSTWPSSPGTNPMATCLMLGRYMGLQIMKEHGY